ncbi:MAG: deazaflavin-dependent oxidoreductase (nitroreductase family) [Candidatus Poriferisodalaceae bacterium]|jgi:deazaflavin-dependent oxidoreductase (nitroreductase family)
MAAKEKGTKIPKSFAKIFGGLHAFVYKATKGRIGGSMGDANIVVLETTGAKSGKKRTNPLLTIDHKDGWAVVASFSGHDAHPGWYHNLKAHPEATLVMGKDRHQVTARDTSGAERAELWDQLTTSYPDYAKYQRVTDRVIPVVALDPR